MAEGCLTNRGRTLDVPCAQFSPPFHQLTPRQGSRPAHQCVRLAAFHFPSGHKGPQGGQHRRAGGGYTPLKMHNRCPDVEFVCDPLRIRSSAFHSHRMNSLALSTKYCRFLLICLAGCAERLQALSVSLNFISRVVLIRSRRSGRYLDPTRARYVPSPVKRPAKLQAQQQRMVRPERN